MNEQRNKSICDRLIYGELLASRYKIDDQDREIVQNLGIFREKKYAYSEYRKVSPL